MRLPGWIRVSVPALRGLFAWALIIWIVVFWRLGYASLLDPDEAHYAQLTREMIQARTWLVALLDGHPYIDKPVLYHWLQAAAVWLLGESAFALRLPSALSAVALISAVGWAGSRLIDSTTGHRAAVMFATLPLSFALASVAVFDMVYTAFLFGGVAALVVASVHRRPRVEFAGWTLVALAVMTKGPMALLLVTLFGVCLWVPGRTRPVVSALRWQLGLAFVVLVVSPWFVWMAIRFQDRFVQDYVLAGNLWYFTGPLEFSSRRADSAFYVRTFIGALFPWSAIALGAGLDAFGRVRAGEPMPLVIRVCWTWILLILGFFSVATFKLDTYIFPAAPAVCLIAADGWTRAAAERSLRTRWTFVSVVAIAVAMVAAGGVVGATLFQLDLGVPWTAITLPIALVAGGGALVVQMRRSRRVPATIRTPVVTLLALYAIVVVIGLPLLERSRPTAPVGRWIARHAGADAPLGVVGLDDWRASIRYYSRRRLAPLNTREEVQQFLAARPDAFILMRRRDYLAMRAEGLNVRAVGGRPAIVGRTGKYLRRQVWGRLTVVTSATPSAQGALEINDLLDPDDSP
jgi:4-amino-4-deoxy-L-arabinose transferase-like glycosyltransferase